jgi:hypothetical protein
LIYVTVVYGSWLMLVRSDLFLAPYPPPAGDAEFQAADVDAYSSGRPRLWSFLLPPGQEVRQYEAEAYVPPHERYKDEPCTEDPEVR